jgi:FKBP-type peptidyl-prolyl cis-trans isomerase SlyD
MESQVISFHCVLKNRLGQVLSTSFNQNVLTIPQEGEDAPLACLNSGLQNITQGEKRRIFVSAAEAYGFYNPEKVKVLPLNFFEEKPRVGELLKLTESSPVFRVTSIENDSVVLDGNHPLAGQDLIFEVEAVAARAATPEELLDCEEPVARIPFH